MGIKGVLSASRVLWWETHCTPFCVPFAHPLRTHCTHFSLHALHTLYTLRALQAAHCTHTELALDTLDDLLQSQISGHRLQIADCRSQVALHPFNGTLDILCGLVGSSFLLHSLEMAPLTEHPRLLWCLHKGILHVSLMCLQNSPDALCDLERVQLTQMTGIKKKILVKQKEI